MSGKTPQSDAFWGAYASHARIASAVYEVVSFGDSPEMANELAELVVAGPKRATASLARYYTQAPDTLPKPGDYVVLVDGDGVPCAIWRTTEVTVKPLIAVDDRFAWDEGEGDRSRAFWLDAHRAFFGAQAAEDGFDMHDQIETVFERFEVVWPLAIADVRPLP
ncbi:ASCH domain-containing protein [Paraburkholderia acidicola]|uniref:ASCH domain-containing protein n=1 Tax=Paraburkholderia acidicola TaxID=1912599 RepID=A0ABV1LTV1_9BURK